jgi:uncharacterized BrkB/YihY/UPF0761 family membrane protein
VNDAPALRAADVGVAMGASGTDVAREAAQIVLLDDDFASIVAGVEEGRSIFANMRKFTSYVLASNVPEMVPFLAYVALPVPLALTVVQILCVDLGTDLLPAIALGQEPPDGEAMKRPPRGFGGRLLDARLLVTSYLFLGLLEAAFAMVVFFVVLRSGGWRYGAPLVATDPLYRSATTATLVSVIFAQVGNLVGRRHDERSGLDRGLLANRLLLVGVALEVAFALAAATWPPLFRALGTGPLPAWALSLAATGAPLVFLADLARKRAFAWAAPARPERHPAARARLSRAAAFARDVLARLDRARTLGLAAETAFWLFLSLVPLAAVAGVLAARLTTRGDWADAAPLVGSLPRAAQALLSVELRRLAAANGGSVGVGSAAVFLWLASTGVHSIFDALEIGAGVARPWWKKRLLAIGMCLVLPLVVALLAAVGAELSGAAGWIGRSLPAFGGTGAPSAARRLGGFLAGAALVLGYVCALYQVGIPARSRRREPLLPGALLAVALELLFGYAYAFYVSKVGDGGAYLAGLAAIGVTMMGLYLFTTALLVGAVVNSSLARGARPEPGGRAPESP